MSKRQPANRRGAKARGRKPRSPSPPRRPPPPHTAPASAADAYLLNEAAVGMYVNIVLTRMGQASENVQIIDGVLTPMVRIDDAMPFLNETYGGALCVNCKRYAKTYQFGNCAPPGCYAGFCSVECSQQGLAAHVTAGHPQYARVEMHDPVDDNDNDDNDNDSNTADDDPSE